MFDRIYKGFTRGELERVKGIDYKSMKIKYWDCKIGIQVDENLMRDFKCYKSVKLKIGKGVWSEVMLWINENGYHLEM